jgi:hypothetical protein
MSGIGNANFYYLFDENLAAGSLNQLKQLFEGSRKSCTLWA